MAVSNYEDWYREVRQFFAELHPNKSVVISAETNLIDSDLLDSVSLVHFLLFVERLLDKQIPIGDFTLDSISSINAIYDNYVL
jgi:acyl carrier protein